VRVVEGGFPTLLLLWVAFVWGFPGRPGLPLSAFVRRLPNQVLPSCAMEEAFQLLGVVVEGQGCKPCPSLWVSPLDLSNELLYPGFDPSLASRD
jgi:hypothetical protein